MTGRFILYEIPTVQIIEIKKKRFMVYLRSTIYQIDAVIINQVMLRQRFSMVFSISSEASLYTSIPLLPSSKTGEILPVNSYK